MRQRFIQSFSTSGDVQTAIDGGQLGKPYVVYLEDEERIDWNSKEATPPLSAQPLTFEIISADTITWKRGDNGLFPAPSRTIEYSINDGPWSSITSTFEGVSFQVNNGDKVKFRGDNNNYSSQLAQAGNTLLVNGTFKLYGNIASLIHSTGYTSVSRIEGVSHFFKGNTGLTEVTEITFGVNNGKLLFAAYAIRELFSECTSLAKIKCLLEQSPDRTISTNWLNGVSPTGTFVKHPDATWTRNENGIPEGWTVEDADI